MLSGRKRSAPVSPSSSPRATAPLAIDILERVVVPAVHVGVPDTFPPLDEDDLRGRDAHVRQADLEVDAPPEDGDAGGDAASVAAGGATCDSDARTGDYCGGDKVSGGDKNTLYRCNGPGRATTVRRCSAGCSVNPGSDDTCKVPVPAGPASCPHVAAVLRFGLHPTASDWLRCVGITAARITQTIGGAPASAGTHLQDGIADGHPYSAATDLSVRGLTDAQVKVLLARLDAMGFAAFFRNPGRDGWPASEARHVHVVFAGARMKASLRAQIADFLAGKNGLASHTAYSFYQPPPEVKAYVRRIFDAAN